MGRRNRLQPLCQFVSIPNLVTQERLKQPDARILSYAE